MASYLFTYLMQMVDNRNKSLVWELFRLATITHDHSSVIGASLNEPHTNDKFVRGKTAVKSGLPHTTVSMVGWFKHYNTRKITLNPYKCVCDTTKTVLRLLVLHINLYGGSCHEVVNG